MSELPRQYRKQLLITKAYSGIPPEARGLMDIQEVQNINQAVEQLLDKQDREYRQRQQVQISKIIERLES